MIIFVDIYCLQNDSYCRYFAWADLKIRGQAKATLLEERDETKDLKVKVGRLSAIIGRYKGRILV